MFDVYCFFVALCVAIMSLNPEDRRMKYPYTYTAKLLNFPYAYYYKHSWLVKYYVIAFGLTIPLMAKITTAGKLALFIFNNP